MQDLFQREIIDNRYRVRELIAIGAFSRVYKIQDLKNLQSRSLIIKFCTRFYEKFDSEVDRSYKVMDRDIVQNGLYGSAGTQYIIMTRFGNSL